jgi:DNA-binding transcriptional regulator YdaS (Cro superfamily)
MRTQNEKNFQAAIKGAIEKAGGATALAVALGVKHQAIYAWRRCPAERVLAVEAASGVSRSELRPDLYPPETTKRKPK